MRQPTRQELRAADTADLEQRSEYLLHRVHEIEGQLCDPQRLPENTEYIVGTRRFVDWWSRAREARYALLEERKRIERELMRRQHGTLARHDPELDLDSRFMTDFQIDTELNALKASLKQINWVLKQNRRWARAMNLIKTWREDRMRYLKAARRRRYERNQGSNYVAASVLLGRFAHALAPLIQAHSAELTEEQTRVIRAVDAQLRDEAEPVESAEEPPETLEEDDD